MQKCTIFTDKGYIISWDSDLCEFIASAKAPVEQALLFPNVFEIDMLIDTVNALQENGFKFIEFCPIDK